MEVGTRVCTRVYISVHPTPTIRAPSTGDMAEPPPTWLWSPGPDLEGRPRVPPTGESCGPDPGPRAMEPPPVSRQLASSAAPDPSPRVPPTGHLLPGVWNLGDGPWW